MIITAIIVISFIVALHDIKDAIYIFQSAYQMTTMGKFQDAIEKLQGILLSITLMSVDSKQDIIEVSLHPGNYL